MKTVFLIDDHPVVALGLEIALADAGSLKLVGVASEPPTGLVKIEAVRPDCLILDLVFAGSVELSLIRHCRDILADTSIIVFSSLPAKAYAHDALSAGADAYLTKDADLADLVALIKKLADTQREPRRAFYPADARVMPHIVAGIRMTPREAQVAASLGRGLSIAAIASNFGMSPNTVAVHRDNIRRKLNCRDTKELVARLARSDLA